MFLMNIKIAYGPLSCTQLPMLAHTVVSQAGREMLWLRLLQLLNEDLSQRPQCRLNLSSSPAPLRLQIPLLCA